jgi:SPP1 family predicted phage head-tail adaptor
MKRKKRTTGSALRDQVKIQQYTTSTDDTGGEVISWTDLATVWCKVDYQIQSDEKEQALQITAYIRINFTIRRVAALHAKMRMLYNGQLCDILTISTDAKKEYQRVECEIRDNDT